MRRRPWPITSARPTSMQRMVTRKSRLARYCCWRASSMPARRYAERATSNSAQSAAAHTLLGNALAGLQQSASAIGEIEQAIELDPAFAPAWTALGSAQLRSGARQQALDAFNRAVALAPASIDARLSLAHYHWATGAVSDAERVLREALGLQPDNPTVHRALALFYMTTGRGHEAEAHFTALAINPAGTLALADYYQATGRPARALDVLRSMQNADDKKDWRAARLKIAAIEYESGQKASAYRIVDELIAEQPNREEPKIAKARLLIRDNDPEQAARLARDALTLNRQSASAHYTLGLAALAVQNLNEAEASFSEVAQIIRARARRNCSWRAFISPAETPKRRLWWLRRRPAPTRTTSTPQRSACGACKRPVRGNQPSASSTRN